MRILSYGDTKLLDYLDANRCLGWVVGRGSIAVGFRNSWGGDYGLFVVVIWLSEEPSI